MKTNIQFITRVLKSENKVFLIDKKTDFKKLGFNKSEYENVKSFLKSDIKLFTVPGNGCFNVFVTIDENSTTNAGKEAIRKLGHSVLSVLSKNKTSECCVINATAQSENMFSFLEGMMLGNYDFNYYKKENKKAATRFKNIKVLEKDLSKDDLKLLQVMSEAVNMVRDWVNEPVNHLNAVQLAEKITEAGNKSGFETTVFGKDKLVELGFGGLLSVNQGSVDPPTFSILNYHPENAVNKQPIVLVGKGVVYDTGGLSLKPTSNSMDSMKSDMAGAATMTGVIYMAAKMKLPLHVIGLIPSTDNRPGFNAFAPGDIIKMYNGMTIEMLNSDAEGRMILGDALYWAQQYKPELVIDAATLTGAAHRALGEHGICYMGTADDETKTKLETTGNEVYERLVEFPLWDEYGDMLKSDIADMKNVGGINAGMITAGKFLQKFTNYPWIHLDIAGMAFFNSSQSYRPKNATGVGVRLLFNFLKQRAAQHG